MTTTFEEMLAASSMRVEVQSPIDESVGLRLSASTRRWRPVVLMHGLNQDHGSLRQLVRWLGEALPGVHVRNLEVGAGRLDSYFGDLNEQVSAVCDALAAAPTLRGGFNAIGVNQGALLLRAYIQRCNTPPVHAYISLGGPHCGVVSVPHPHDPLGDALLRNGAFGRSASAAGPTIEAQRLLTVAQYWRDPFRLDDYRNGSAFLADLNNERPRKNGDYRRQLLRLGHLVLLMFDDDDLVAPRESALFSCLAPRSTQRLIPLHQSELFEEDWLGLRELHESGRLHLLRKPGRHLSFNRSFFEDQIARRFLSDELPP